MSIFKKKISDSEVLEYLEANPDFFINHPDILEILEIKHASGDATSLIEKQVEIIKEKKGENGMIIPEEVAETYLFIAKQKKSTWTHEIDIRAFSDQAWWNH